jgi:DNA-directed RNA polymerase specialized sigma24 family protein
MADCLIAELYARECRPLTRLAVLLVLDSQAAEEVVTDAFAAICRGWRRPRDSEEALPCLHRAVVSKSRAVRRQRAGAGGSAQLERFPVVTVLRGLPQRQREAIVLRYYAGLSEAEVAAAMGVRKGLVKSYLARGRSSLRPVLEQGTAEG